MGQQRKDTRNWTTAAGHEAGIEGATRRGGVGSGVVWGPSRAASHRPSPPHEQVSGLVQPAVQPELAVAARDAVAPPKLECCRRLATRRQHQRQPYAQADLHGRDERGARLQTVHGLRRVGGGSGAGGTAGGQVCRGRQQPCPPPAAALEHRAHQLAHQTVVQPGAGHGALQVLRVGGGRRWRHGAAGAAPAGCSAKQRCSVTFQAQHLPCSQPGGSAGGLTGVLHRAGVSRASMARKSSCATMAGSRPRRMAEPMNRRRAV